MSKFNFKSWERRIAIYLNRYPSLKLIIKKGYQYFNYYLYRSPYRFKCSNELYKLLPPNYSESFFGYYDKSPISEDGKWILLHATNHSTKSLPTPSKTCDIVLYSVENNQYKIIGSTKAYNWQQGAKLQWLNSNSIIYNDYDENKNRYVSKVYNITMMKHTQLIDWAIYDCYENYALTINFDRLAMLRPDYGYRNNLNNLDSNYLSNMDGDGIRYVNLSTNKSQLLYSLSEIIRLDYDPNMNQALHKLNHISISPDGDQFIFLHRYFLDGVKYDRLILASVNNNNMTVISDHEMISHCFWENNDTIIAYMRRNGKGDKYYRVDLTTNQIDIIGEGIIDQYGDGHPNIFNTKMLFDTYPNKRRMKSLFVYDIGNNCIDFVGEFFEPLSYYSETRCDLHPRWSYDGNSIFFDSVHTGKRALYMTRRE